MRTRLSSALSSRPLRLVPVVSASGFPASSPAITNFGAHARRLTLALAASAPLCAGALWAAPAQAAPTAESDEYGPIVQIVRPGYNDVLKGTYKILIQVAARKFNPESVEMFIDDKPATDGPMALSSLNSSSYDLKTNFLTEGPHKLTVRVTDSQGFRGWSETTILVNNKGVPDNEAPNLRWVGLDPFQEVSGSMKIEVDAADNFGVKMLIISVNPVVPSADIKPQAWYLNQPPYRVNLDTIGKNLPDGLYVVKAQAYDSLDQQGEATPLTFGIVNDQINATRVEDMLEGQRQMALVLKGQKPEKNVSTQAATQKNTPALPAEVAPVPYAAPASGKGATATLPPTAKIPAQPANPGIQVPLVKTPGSSVPQDAVPREVAPAATPDAPGTSNGVRTAETALDTDAAPAAAPVMDALGGSDDAPQTGSATDSTTANSARPLAPTTQAPTERTLVARIPQMPIGQRNAGEASLSRAGAIDLAITPAAQVQEARAIAPIAVSRFGQPLSAGRAISDSPVWSQSAGITQTRLSNAELSRLGAGKLNASGDSRQSAARSIELAASSKATRALQTSAPVATERPVLSRAISSDSVSAPAPKLTREAQSAAQATSEVAPTGTLSNAVRIGQRAQPIAPQTEGAATTAETRGAMSKAGASRGRVKPLEIAPERIAKNGVQSAAQTPQMSAPLAPRMSESASGAGVPTKSANPIAKAEMKTVKVTPNGERVAALPRPDAARRNPTRNGAFIVAAPLEQSLQIAAPTAFAIPDAYRADRPTTLRAIAARFGLPVELVAISNDLGSDAKVAKEVEIKLPRPLEVSYNGVPIKGDAPSMLMGDTAVTAFRFMFEQTGGKLEWDAKNQRVVARKNGREITLNIGSNVAKIGDREVMMEIAAFLFQGRTMVPLRFFEEGMNAQVEWNPQTGRIVVAMAG